MLPKYKSFMQDIDFKFKKVGIWGFGVVGKAALRFFSEQLSDTIVINKKELTQSEKDLFRKTKTTLAIENEKTLYDFWQKNEYILVSPGIDISHYIDYQHKIITELDILQMFFTKPIIAITGTVGKTSITHLLTQQLQQNGIKAIAAGNIGIGMLDVINKQHEIDIAVLELSSFQLEHCKSFKPDLAIWTNFYPNHLDRHKTINAYFKSKYKVIEHQKNKQKALLPLSLENKIKTNEKKNISYFSENRPSSNVLKKNNKTLYWIEDNNIKKYQSGNETILYHLNKLPNISFQQNWLIIISALDILNYPITKIFKDADKTMFEHRIEHVATINNIVFYNDSKSTIIQSTLCAIQKFEKPTILFLGGVSKGVNREPLIDQLPKNIKSVLCFGKEASQLKLLCNKYNINAYEFEVLEDAFNYCKNTAQAGDIVLFSPAGASFDLYKNYKERGKHFKKLVKTI